MPAIDVTLTRPEAESALHALDGRTRERRHEAKSYPATARELEAIAPVADALRAALASGTARIAIQATYHDLAFALQVLSESASTASCDGEYETQIGLDRAIAAIETAKTEALRPKVAVSGHREAALELHRRLGTDAMMRQGDPVETIAHALALAADAASDGAGQTLSRLRAAGWMVAVHNDYRLNGTFNTFWLFTRRDGMSAKGEGASDAIALALAAERIAEIEAADPK